MLDGLLGRGFSSKCKSLIKPTRTRIDVLRRRQEVTQRFLKGNLAQLLSNGLDIDAYGRTEEYIAGLNILSCYDFIEWCCEYILKQLSLMQKERECPKECREAVGSFMFAAARFSDLPELCYLRDLFQQRYGNSLEHFVNHDFVDKLALKPPTTEKKLQLLQDIALEYSIKWDFRGFQQRIANPYAFAQDLSKTREPTYDKSPNHNNTLQKSEKQYGSSKERNDLADGRRRACKNGNDEVLKRNQFTSSNFKSLTDGEQTISERDYHEVPSHRSGELNYDKHALQYYKDDNALESGRSGRSSSGKRPELVNDERKTYYVGMDGVPKRYGPEYHGKPKEVARVPAKSDNGYSSSADNYKQITGMSTSNTWKEETGKLKDRYRNGLPPPYLKPKDNLIPPPYTKSRESKHGANAESKHASSNSDGAPIDLSMLGRENAVHRSERTDRQFDRPIYEERGFGPARLISDGHEKDRPYHEGIPLPRPRSMRRKHSKSSCRDNLCKCEESEDAGVVKGSPSSRRKESSRRGLQILFDDEHYQKDEEERMIDKLLLHYSKKPSNFDPEKLIRKPKSYPSHQLDAIASETPHYRSRDRSDVGSEMAPHPTRSISLPREQTGTVETVKVYTRATSFQPDKPACHVHPKLPDYDDLAARFAALKGR